MTAGIYLNNGIKLAQEGRLQEAAQAFLEAINLQPDYPEAYYNLGLVFKNANRLEAAETSFRRAILLNPYHLEAYYNLGLVLTESKRLDEAEACFHRIIELNPQNPLIFNEMGKFLAHRNRQAEAAACFFQATKLSQDFREAYYNLGVVLMNLHRMEDAEICFRRAIELDPVSLDAEITLGKVYLFLGRYEEGWQKLEGRCKVHGFTQPQVRRWQGENLAGCKILLFHEQGLGDTIQFARYVPMVAEMASEAIIWVQKPLERLFSAMGENVAFRSGESIPLAEYKFDYACPLFSLPCVFNTSVDTIPQTIPYIMSNRDISARWREALGQIDNNGTYRIGIVWAGNPENKNDHNRSIKFELISSLFDVEGISWVNLQVGSRTEELVKTSHKVIDFSHELVDFSETAGLIENLNLVITVDTAIAHLAGAMGKQTWLLLSFIHDFRWLLDRNDSPWYPTMRIFRQSKIGDWQEVLERVKGTLKEEVNRTFGVES